ncbi:MAG: hypothetical protein NVS3B7_15100 [Candidatus Elarobacter sp.]
MEPGTTTPDEEPGLTQKNSATVTGEETLVEPIPTSYGPGGSTAPQADESSGENGTQM